MPSACRDPAGRLFGAPAAGGALYDILITFPDGKTRPILGVAPGQKVLASAIYSPLKLTVTKIENKALFYRETIFELSWEANPLNSNIAKYRLYDVTGAKSPLGDFAATTFQTTLRNMDKAKTYRFALTAVDAWGSESDPVFSTSAAGKPAVISRRPASGKISKVNE